MFDKLRRVWPLLFSSFFGFLLATFIFMPRAYSSNQNVYKILREKINVLQQIISYILNKNEVSDFVECGCWKGHSSFIISKLITSSKKKINLHIFDSFEGLSVSTKNDQGFHLRDQSEQDRVAKYFSRPEEFLKKEVLNEFDFVKVYKGWIPERFNEIEEKKFSLIHLDVDLYEPTYESLKFFFPSYYFKSYNKLFNLNQ